MKVALPKDFEPDWASPREWASMYRGCGLQVVPAHMPSQADWKFPKLTKWKTFQDELVPDPQFERWYGSQGEYSRHGNMGLLTGRASGNVFVIDLDEYKNNGALQWWRGALDVHNNGMEVETCEQMTGGGGRQLFYRARADWTAPTNRTPIGVDIRGQGGFAMMPPSLHASGKHYAWKDGCAPWECEIAEAPEWLLEAVIDLVKRHGGDVSQRLPAERREHSGADLNAFGIREDGREEYMTRLVWAAVVNWYRECPIAPTDDESQKRMREAWAIYERKTKSRIAAVDKVAGLEQEGRGPTLFADKWRRAMSKWSTDVAEAAQHPFEQDEWRAATRVAVATVQLSGRFVFEKIHHLRTLPPTKWLAKGWVPENSTGIFYGKWAAGKSFIGFDFALHLAYGMPDWHGVELPGRSIHVLIIAREGHQGFVNRIDAFKKRYGLIDDAEHITFMRGSVSFMRDEEFAALCEAIKADGTPYQLILVDTVARVLPGVDMNEQQTVTLFMERVSLLGGITGAASIGVHHQNKSGGMMGSTFFEANADFVFEITRSGEEDEPLTRGEILCTKMKDGEDRWKRLVSYEKVPLSIVPDGPSSLVVADIRRASRSAGEDAWPIKDVCRRVLAFIHEEWSTGSPLAKAANLKGSGRYAPEVIARKFDLSVRVAEWMVEQWLSVRPAVLAIEMADKKSKQKGLKVVGSID